MAESLEERRKYKVPELKSTIDILKLLNKSNCKDCGDATCLAFAAAVFKGERPLSECPHLESHILDRYTVALQSGKVDNGPDQEQMMLELKARLKTADLKALASRTGGAFLNDKLTISVLGKDVSIDNKGNLYSDIHLHAWLTVPLMAYGLEGKGETPKGEWLPFRELPHGKDWHRFFEHRCEKTLKKVADLYTDLFEDMLHIFQARQIDNLYGSDISIVLYPLPKLPILICYWRPEEGMESSIHLFFDSSAEANLRIDAIYLLCTGLVIMFEKIAQTHS